MTGFPTIAEVEMTVFGLEQLEDGVVLYWHGENDRSKFGQGGLSHSVNSEMLLDIQAWKSSGQLDIPV